MVTSARVRASFHNDREADEGLSGPCSWGEMMRVTRADVARRAGVSPAVVSYVLNPGSRPVAAATRERVLAAVTELGYRPDAVAQSLRSGPTRSLGLLVPSLVNPFFAELSRSIESLAFERGYVLLVGSTEAAADRELRYVHSFADRRVDALIMVTSTSADALKAAGDTGVPVVTLDRTPNGSAVSSVITDGSAGIRAAIDHLTEHGHRRIGVLGGPDGLTVADERTAAWRTALSDAGLWEDDVCVRAAFSRRGGADGASVLLERGPMTALVTSSDVQAIGALDECIRRGLRVPQELSIVSFDDTEAASYAQPRLTAVQQPIEQMAEATMELVLQRIGAGETAASRHVLPTTLVVRDSTGPVRA